MGFLKKQSYPARRNRIPQGQSHPASVIPPSSYGAHDPQPMPPSAYQSNGMATVVPASSAVAATAGVGSFPSNTAPVQATVYVPGQGGQTAATTYVPGGAQRPVQATVYNPNGPNGNNNHNAAVGPPASNPLYQAQRPSFNNGNASYNSDESAFWECLVCTFPNMRTEANCKGCGSPIPPGMLYSTTSAACNNNNNHNCGVGPPQDQTTTTTMMNNLSLGGGGASGGACGSGGSTGGGGVMRVHIPNGMRPGQKIKVRSPDGKEVVKAIPPRSEWNYDGTKHFFRMQFGSSPAALPPPASAARPSCAGAPPPHSTAWRDFYASAPAARYSDPPLGARSVPHSPRGGMGLPPNGRHKSLIVGINYHGTRAELRGCINDARNMQNLLRRNGFPDDGSHMLLLTDERARGNEYQPTVKNLMKAFRWFMKDVRRGDVLFFHFSGHGGQVPDRTGHEEDGYNETVIPVDFERNGQITDDVLWGSLVYDLPEGARMTALMDMCHSGTGLDLPYDYNVNTGRWKEDTNPAHSAGDVVLFSGCEDSQTSADVGGTRKRMAGGAMTLAFTKAYEETAAMSTYHEFLDAVKTQLRRTGFKQRPQLTSSQQFDAGSRIFSLGHCSPRGGVPSVIEPNHNPKVGRQKRRHMRAGRRGGGGGGGGDLFGLGVAAVGAALFADALF